MTGTDAAPDPRYPLAWYPPAQRLGPTDVFSDTGADPLHARKMCAALQHATAPVLIRREVEGGHGARAVSRAVALTTNQLCFLAQYTGLDLEAVYTR